LTLSGVATGIFLRVWLVTVPFAVAAAATIMLASQLKRVFLEGENLVVTNYFQSLQVPCAIIAEIQERRLLNIRPVWLFFTIQTAFGYRIAFIPRMGVVPFWKSHPVVQLLREKARRS